ncbi:MAG: hypothetical protein IJ379_03990 [Lachnospiraceae bacterium]|nr:hypothetical protein [Lachnospiraceae bacterium]
MVIPDTCMDIIFDIDYTNNSYSHSFCALDEHSFRSTGSKSENLTDTFAIRFYAWSVILFTEQDLSGTKNNVFCVEAFFENYYNLLC